MCAPVRVLALALVSFASLACRTEQPDRAPALPPGRAGDILAHAIEAAGGWRRWSELRDVSFVSSIAFFHPLAGEVRESFGLYKMPLRAGRRVRFESLDAGERVAVGLDGEEIWLERGGLPVCDPPRFTLARLHLTGNLFWFSLPFSLVDAAADVTDAGDQSLDGRTFTRLRVGRAGDAPTGVVAVPGAAGTDALVDWFVVYLDAETGSIDRVLGHVTAPFLSHSLWVAIWRDYREVAGVRIAHRRDVFPADAAAVPVGPRALDQVVDEIRVNPGFPAVLFEKPLTHCR